MGLALAPLLLRTSWMSKEGGGKGWTLLHSAIASNGRLSLFLTFAEDVCSRGKRVTHRREDHIAWPREAA